MTTLPWIRLDTNIGLNPKILALTESKRHRAAFAYVCSLAYCGGHGLDGFIPKVVLPVIHATTAEAKALVDVGLWIELEGGWQINGWDEYQVSSDETRARRDKARKAAQARWHGAQACAQ